MAPEVRTRWAGTALVALLAIVVQLPFLERGLAPLDEGTVLANADALARGEVLYRDRITIVAPLSYEALALAFRFFGADLAVARALQAAIFVACMLVALGVLRRATSEAWALAGTISLLALKPLGFLSWTIANYSPFGLLALLLALGSLARWLAGGRRRDLVATGLASGLVFVSKQNLAAVAALAVASVLLAAWWSTRPRRLRSLAAAAGLLLAASLAPVAAVALRYLHVDALGPAFDQVIASMPRFAADWSLPFPPIAPWSPDDPSWGIYVFAYLPQPVVEAVYTGALPLSGSPLRHAVEWGVKLCYALPLAAIALVVVRWVAGPGPRSERSVPLACALFAAGSFASMAYRPDWAHLMNVWPLLHLVVVAAIAGERGRLRALLAGASALVWLGLTALTCWSFVALDWEDLRTPRGRIRVTATAAPALRALLEWESRVPEEERIAFLPALPQLHFLTARPLPLAADALIPGLFDASDEERMLGQLDGVSHVLFDARPLIGVAADVIDVAPRLSRALATQFRHVQTLAPSFLAFERRPEAPAAQAQDLWGAATVASGTVHARGEHWLFHRVWAFSLPAAPESSGCVEAAWRFERGDRVAATPMSHPSLWHAGSALATRGIAFEMSVFASDGTREATRSAVVSAAGPAEPWRLTPELSPGSEAVLRLCARSLPDPDRLAPDRLVRVGWAEPRVERGEGAVSRRLRP